jgi:hypothetical protein
VRGQNVRGRIVPVPVTGLEVLPEYKRVLSVTRVVQILLEHQSITWIADITEVSECYQTSGYYWSISVLPDKRILLEY